MAQRIPRASFRDSLYYNLVHVIPYVTQGIFTRSRFWVTFWTKVHPDPMAVKFGHYLREKYKSPYLFINMVTTKSLMLFDLDGIRQVLDHSPFLYADAKSKRDGMSHFQPNAVTISRGEEWRDRREFNEAVLNYGYGLHPYAAQFLQVIRDEIAARNQSRQLTWADFDDLFEKITLQIIFGKEARDDVALTRWLHQMMRESNRLVGLRKSKYFDAFYEKIRGYLGAPGAGSLVTLCRQVPSDPATKIENQIPHWMFAMNETLSTNTARALAAIVAHPQAEAQVRAEMAQADLTSPAGIDSLKYLEGCLQEAMRLWPTTPILARETVFQSVLGGETIPQGTQVLILNNFNHRDRQTHAFADTFSPEVWMKDGVDYSFNHLSNGSQVCAGKDLLLFIGKAVLVTLLIGHRYTLEQPALDPASPMPYTFNYFDLKLNREPITAGS